MARNWIKIETTTPDKPEICAIATVLSIDPDAALGKLVRLWAWAEVNKIDGNAVKVTREFIDKVVGLKGFASALEQAGWLSGKDQELVFTHFSKHNGKGARNRALTAERVSQHRERKRSSNDERDSSNEFVVTKAAVEEVKSAPESEQVNEVKSVDNPLISSLYSESEVEETSVITPEEFVADEASLAESDLLVTDEIRGGIENVTNNSSEDEFEEEGKVSPSNDVDSGRKRSTSSTGPRKVQVADPPDQPFLF